MSIKQLNLIYKIMLTAHLQLHIIGKHIRVCAVLCFNMRRFSQEYVSGALIGQVHCKK